MRIAVVGAGIAGLSAARALADRGHQVVVHERSSMVGGRAGTRQIRAVEMPRGLAGASLAFDYGAQYFTVRDERFSAAAAEWERDRVIARWTGRIVVFDGEGWEDVDDDTARYVGIPGMGAIATALSAGIEIKHGTKIESLDELASSFDRIIVATPAPHAAALVAHVPALGPAVSRVRMMPSWTVAAAFEDRVAARFDAAFVNGSPLGWMARNTSKPKRDWRVDTWVIQATTAWSAAHIDDRSDDVGAFLMEAFDDLVSAGLPRAFYATVHRWRYATAEPPLAIGAIHDRESRITVCGDWCLGSRIEDAYLSGLDAALLSADS
jgi:predicted NAD/FAD-dependent oxidoreductase